MRFVSTTRSNKAGVHRGRFVDSHWAAVTRTATGGGVAMGVDAPKSVTLYSPGGNGGMRPLRQAGTLLPREGLPKQPPYIA